MKIQEAEKTVLEGMMTYLNDPVTYTGFVSNLKASQMHKIDKAIEKYLDILAKRLVTIKGNLGELE